MQTALNLMDCLKNQDCKAPFCTSVKKPSEEQFVPPFKNILLPLQNLSSQILFHFTVILTCYVFLRGTTSIQELLTYVLILEKS